MYCVFCCCLICPDDEESELETELPGKNPNETVVNMEPPNPEFLKLEYINGVPQVVEPDLQPIVSRAPLPQCSRIADLIQKFENKQVSDI